MGGGSLALAPGLVCLKKVESGFLVFERISLSRIMVRGRFWAGHAGLIDDLRFFEVFKIDYAVARFNVVRLLRRAKTEA